MGKTKDARAVNRNVKTLNRQLKEDVFESRFEAKQIRKGWGDGIEYFMYELIDHVQPERNKIIPWETAFAICKFNCIWREMNDFIVTSDFWDNYWGKDKTKEQKQY